MNHIAHVIYAYFTQFYKVNLKLPLCGLLLTNSSTSRKISWEEIYKHNKLDDCWVVVHGKVYDVTSWVPKHPGGRIILNGAGRESTALFESYHPEWVHNKLPQFQIGQLETYNPYYSWNQSKFYTTVKQ
jgi:cytochrome b involved in lipid metabolism